MDDGVCKQIAGEGNVRMFALLKYLEDKQKDVWLRSVLLQGLTDGEEYIAQLSSYIQGLNNVQRFELLPCHDLAANKYNQLGLKNHASSCAKYDVKTLQRIKARYNELLGEKVII